MLTNISDYAKSMYKLLPAKYSARTEELLAQSQGNYTREDVDALVRHLKYLRNTGESDEDTRQRIMDKLNLSDIDL